MTTVRKDGGFLFDEFAGVQNAARVEGPLDLMMERTDRGRRGERPPGHFGEADAMLASDDAVPGEDLAEEFIQGGAGAGGGAGS